MKIITKTPQLHESICFVWWIGFKFQIIELNAPKVWQKFLKKIEKIVNNNKNNVNNNFDIYIKEHTASL